MYSTSESDSELCLTLAITVKKSSRPDPFRPVVCGLWANVILMELYTLIAKKLSHKARPQEATQRILQGV